MRTYLAGQSRLLAIALAAAVVAYVGWKVILSPDQALQFTFNGLSVGAVYALLAIGFTIVYSTVWFFDLYYGSAAALGAYGVFYLRSQETLGGQYAVNTPYVNLLFALVVAGVVAWALHTAFYHRLQSRFSPTALRVGGGSLAAGAGAYTGFVLTYPQELHVTLSPAAGLAVALVAVWGLHKIYQRITGQPIIGQRIAGSRSFRLFPVVVAIGVIGAAVLGTYCGLLISQAPGSKLYLSWAVSCLLAGAVGLALYRGLYVYMRQRARSPLVMLVASLGILLAITAFITIVFDSPPRPLPDPFGSQPRTIGGANIKGFNVFTIGVALAGFGAMLFLLKKTSFGRAVRAIGDDEEVSRVVGINTTVVISIVFFIGAVFAALAGLLSGHDTAIQPKMGLLLLLKGWIASVVGGIGNLYGAIIGGFILGLVEQFGIWDLAGEWKDVISFLVLILFLSFWPLGLLPRK